MRESPFKAYDIRGRVDDTLTEALMRRTGHAFAAVMARGAPVVIGRDARESSPRLAAALAEGVCDGGSDVLDIGLCGTEEVYFATDHLRAGGGLMVTASHNPKGDNGLKLVGAGARPVDRPGGLDRIEALAMGQVDLPRPAAQRGKVRQAEVRVAYVEKIASFVAPETLPPVHLMANAGNGAAGPAFDAVLAALTAAGAALTVTRLHHTPDPTFPNGIPNPLLPENQPANADAVRTAGADLGLAWDGDFDRCFFFDASGGFVDGAYIVGLLAGAILARHPGEAIVHDGRVFLNTRDIVARAGGRAVAAPTGHALMKAAMRRSNAIYGGEMSAHHYFRDFMFCDSGMIPWLLILAEMGRTGRSLAELVAARIAAFPVSGERNFRLADPALAIARVEAAYAPRARARDDGDGLSLEFDTWRFNLRRSNTEALVRLNVEAAGDRTRVEVETAAISALLSG
ncbi:MAG: phosphomannomutase [Pseudomonadota bacterium]